MSAWRRLGLSLAVGCLHAAGLIVVALDLGYAIGPADYSPLGLSWRYGGLLVVAAIPVWLALRYRLVLPVVALALTTGYVLGLELAPPGPTFHDVAELEHLAEPTGITVVENGLYIVRYMVHASVWSVGFLLVGLVEYAARTRWGRLPPIQNPSRWVSIPAPRRRAVHLATGGGLLHGIVMVGFAHRLGVSIAGVEGWVLYAFAAGGMWLLAAVPIYLLFHRRVLAPVALLTVVALLDVRASLTAGVEEPHVLYFWGWFVVLAAVLIVAVVEFGLRRVRDQSTPDTA